MKRRFLFLGLASLCIAACVFGLFLWWVSRVQNHTEVTFLNIGEGDAILISQGMNQVLVDSGRNSRDLLGRLGRHMPFWDRQIEMVIETHPDADHIGGFAGLMRAYQVEQVLSTGAESDTETFRLLDQSIRENVRNEPQKIFRGTKITFPLGGELAIEYPDAPLSKEAMDTNSGSIVARFVYGETSILLTGDLPREETVLSGEAPVTILKAAHHGSRYSTSDIFLDLVRPKEAIISVGKNMYGHPSSEVIERLQKHGIETYRTDQEGDITYVCADNQCKRK